MTRTANRPPPTGTMPRRAAAHTPYIYVLLAGVLLAALCAPAVPAAAQVPDNRSPKLDPEDSVPPAYRDTLDARDRQRLDAARQAGETFIPVLQGRGVAPDERRDAPARQDAGVPAPTPPQPAYEGYRRPDTPRRRTGEQDGRAAGGLRSEGLRPEGLRPEGLRPEGLVDVLIEAWTRPPEIVRVRYPQAAVRNPDASEDRDAVQGAGPEPQTAASSLPHIAAGRGLYARTLYAVNSDYPGPVLL